jgi:photosystem II stability/assembly factor-like uncharacterized protein
VLSNFLANMAVSTLVMDRVNPNIIYAGTGEGFFNVDAIRGAGIFKTTNGGASWTQLASTRNANFQFVNRLAISPDNQTILAATNNGCSAVRTVGETGRACSAAATSTSTSVRPTATAPLPGATRA